MRKLTANEINEIAEVFKATLEACVSPKKAKRVETKTAASKTTVVIDGQEVDLQTLPVGTVITCRGFVYFRHEIEWRGVMGAKDPKGEHAAYEMNSWSDNSPVEFIYRPDNPRSPDSTAYFENKEELRKAVVEDQFLDFNGHQFIINQGHIPENAVIVANSRGISLFKDPLFSFYDAMKGYGYRPKEFPEWCEEYGFPLRLDFYLSPQKPA
jgi:hypothetical protein|nr:MAG TPA: hypothetical protein [Caudoviricetes sp.]